jgi:hypothetical protein
MIEKMCALHGLRQKSCLSCLSIQNERLLPSYPLIISERRFCTGSKETAKQAPVRKHRAQEEEAAKTSWLEFDASASGAGF